MSDYLSNLAGRSLNLIDVVKPRTISIFEPLPIQPEASFLRTSRKLDIKSRGQEGEQLRRNTIVPIESNDIQNSFARPKPILGYSEDETGFGNSNESNPKHSKEHLDPTGLKLKSEKDEFLKDSISSTPNFENSARLDNAEKERILAYIPIEEAAEKNKEIEERNKLLPSETLERRSIKANGQILKGITNNDEGLTVEADQTVNQERNSSEGTYVSSLKPWSNIDETLKPDGDSFNKMQDPFLDQGMILFEHKWPMKIPKAVYRIDPHFSEGKKQNTPEPVIQVTIGRIEVKASQQSSKQKSSQTQAQTAPSLNEYLKRRSNGGIR